MERKIHSVVSLEDQKVTLSKSKEGQLVVIKKTNDKEYQNLIQIKKHLQSVDANFEYGGAYEYRVITPLIKSWNSSEGLLETEYFDGENLEVLMQTSNSESRRQSVTFLKYFIQWMRLNGIVWNDAAPRNILINQNKKEVCLVDFERGCVFQEWPYSQTDFDFLIRGLVFEEMSAFLFTEERNEIFGNIWYGEDKIITSKSFRGKREPILYMNIYGEFGEFISSDKLNRIRMLMADMLTPYKLENGTIFFPLTILANAGSPEKYANLLLKLTQIDKKEWPRFLTNSIQP